MCFAFITRFDDVNNELLLTPCITHTHTPTHTKYTPNISLITITREKGPLDEVQVAALVTAGGSRGTEPKVMHHGHPRGEAAVGPK